MDKVDHCTWFVEEFRGVKISDCCRIHDDTYSTRQFYNCLAGKIGKFHASWITAGGAIGSWVKYPITMWKRI